MTIDEELTKGQRKKLGALKKLIGDELGEAYFSKWLKQENAAREAENPDPVATKILDALAEVEDDKSFRLGNFGYTVRRARGQSARGFLVTRNQKR